MLFYQGCLGGNLEFQTIGDSPFSTKLPPLFKKCILHATLECGDTVLLGTDMVGATGLKKGNSVSMMLDCESEMEIRDCFSKLSKNGVRITPLEKNHWGILLGEIKDKYGNYWLLRYQERP